MCGSPCFRGLKSLCRRMKRARPETFRAGCGKLSGGHKSFRGECGKYLRKFPQATPTCGTLAEVSASSLKCAGRLRKFPQAHSSVRGVCGSFRKLLASVRGVCGSFRKLTQACGTFAELSASSLKCADVCGSFRKLTQACGTFAEVSASTPQYFLRPSRLPQKSKREIRSLYRRTSRFSQWRRRATSGPHLSYPLIYQWFRSPSARRRVVRPYHRSGNAVWRPFPIL